MRMDLGSVIRRGLYPVLPRRGYLPKNKKEKTELGINLD